MFFRKGQYYWIFVIIGAGRLVRQEKELLEPFALPRPQNPAI